MVLHIIQNQCDYVSFCFVLPVRCLFLVLKILILKTTLQEPYNITYDITLCAPPGNCNYTSVWGMRLACSAPSIPPVHFQLLFLLQFFNLSVREKQSDLGMRNNNHRFNIRTRKFPEMRCSEYWNGECPKKQKNSSHNYMCTPKHYHNKREGIKS